MDIGKAFTFFTEDERWVNKLAIGTLVALLSTVLFIPLFILWGYELAITRNVLNGEERPLPEWDNVGQYFMDGLTVGIARLVYSLPLIVLLCSSLAVFVLPALSGGNEGLATALAGTAVAVWALLTCLLFLFALALAFITPAIHIQYVRTGELSACFRFGEVWNITREHLGDIVVELFALVVAWLIISAVSGALSITVCGAFLATWAGIAWVRFIAGHMNGQIARKLGGKAVAFA